MKAYNQALEHLRSACNDGVSTHLNKLISAKKMPKVESVSEDMGEPQADNKLELLEAYKKRK